ncbi:hypothetical protein TKK_0017218 [Trichogramma kaykai]
MLALQKLGKQSMKIAANQQVRNFIVSKPQVRISFAEKVTHGLILFSVPMIIPLYLSTKFAEWTMANQEKS